MRNTIYALTAMLAIGAMAAQAAPAGRDIISGVSVDSFSMNREGKYLAVDMDLNLDRLKVGSNRAVLLTPRLVHGADSLDLPSIGIYGRRRYYYYVRNGVGTITGKDETAFQANDKPAQIDYSNLAEYQDWMEGAALKFYRSDWGCCHKLIAQYEGTLGRLRQAFFPELIFVQPKAELRKARSLSGSAFIDFPVDQTVIYPDYRRNTVELAKIQATIDSVRNDVDVTIDSVSLKGFASPESPYKHNTDLAIGRTAALKKHIQQLYHFEPSTIKTAYEPEDWDGLRRFVENSNIDHRAEILALINSDMEPDAKEAKIKKLYPAEYRFMLQNFYPALRHTDYRIDYVIRSFNNVDEIKRIMASQPQKLSQNEFYLVAQEYEPGSDEFTNVFETAIHLFPNDTVANLNAANAAMRQGNYDRARQYLLKAGDSAEAVYARGALAIREKRYDDARRYMKQAAAMGLKQASVTLNELEERLKE